MVFTNAHVLSWMVFGSALAKDDVPCFGVLATEELNTKPFAYRIATVVGTSLSFLVCHDLKFWRLFLLVLLVFAALALSGRASLFRTSCSGTALFGAFRTAAIALRATFALRPTFFSSGRGRSGRLFIAATGRTALGTTLGFARSTRSALLG